MIGYESTACSRCLWRGIIAGFVAATVMIGCMRSARAAPVWQVVAPDGSTVTLDDAACPWSAAASIATHRAPSGVEVRGCWLMVDDHALLVYDDGDRGRISRESLRRVVSL